MNILVPYFVLVLNFYPSIDYPTDVSRSDIWMADVTVGAQIAELLSLEGQIKTEMYQKTWIKYSPFQAEYYVRAFVEFNGFSIGVEHVCYHPIVNRESYLYRYEGGHNRVFFKFDTRGR